MGAGGPLTEPLAKSPDKGSGRSATAWLRPLTGAGLVTAARGALEPEPELVGKPNTSAAMQAPANAIPDAIAGRRRFDPDMFCS
jgi:hypothetical protein